MTEIEEELSPRPSTIDPMALSAGLNRLPQALKQMGWAGMRKGQDRVVHALMAGRDVFCVMSTSAGKTGCYVLPTLAMEWRTLIFSPLVALMENQKDAMLEAGVQARALHSGNAESLNANSLKDWVQGRAQILLVAPERVNNEAFIGAMNQVKPDAVILDEAHTLSKWTKTFRPSYMRAGRWVQQLQPRVIGTFTATCTPKDEEEIRAALGLQHAHKIAYLPLRENLHLSSSSDPSAEQGDRRTSTEAIADWIVENCREGQVLCYCYSTRRAEEMAQALSLRDPMERSSFYHAKVTASARANAMRGFMQGDVKYMAATSAFGMGIDKPDIRHLIHRDMPGNISSLEQEVGRAGRDGDDSWCHAFFCGDSENTQKFFLRQGNPSEKEVRDVFQVLAGMKDMNGVLRASAAKVSEGCSRELQPVVGAAMKFLISSDALVPVSKSDSLTGVQWRRVASMTQDQIKTRDAMYDIGEEDEELPGRVLFSQEALADIMGIQKPAVAAKLRRFSEAGVLDYTPPPKVTPMRVAPDLSHVDFSFLEYQSKTAHQAFQQVLDYNDVPDEEKKAYIKRCLASDIEA